MLGKHSSIHHRSVCEGGSPNQLHHPAEGGGGHAPSSTRPLLLLNTTPVIRDYASPQCCLLLLAIPNQQLGPLSLYVEYEASPSLQGAAGCIMQHPLPTHPPYLHDGLIVPVYEVTDGLNHTKLDIIINLSHLHRNSSSSSSTSSSGRKHPPQHKPQLHPITPSHTPSSNLHSHLPYPPPLPPPPPHTHGSITSVRVQAWCNVPLLS